MAYIKRIQIEQCRNVQKLDLDLSVEESSSESKSFRHLILTGPNGSGKSGVLAAIAGCIGDTLSARPLKFKQTRPRGDGLGDVYLAVVQTEPDLVWLDWIMDTEPSAQKLPMVSPDVFEAKLGSTITAYLPAHGRRLVQKPVSGPQKLDHLSAESNRVDEQLSPYFQQFLVNKHTEMTYAKVDGDATTADRIEAWFNLLWKHVRQLMEGEIQDIRYDRKSYTFVFQRRDGYEFDLATLADGHAAVFGILAEIFLRGDLLRTSEPEGIVLIDEIEQHLHLSLQEQILPLLTHLFPRLQFIIATHSPAVIASIPGAVVYDLKKQQKVLSDGYRGIPYGMLMTEHFGISSDIDLDSTRQLLRLRELAQKSVRLASEDNEFNQIAETLSSRSEVLATEVWMVKERMSVSSVHLSAKQAP